MDVSPQPERQGHETKTDNQQVSKAAFPYEQVRAIAERVYAMLLRDLKYERERNRITFGKPNPYKGGR